MKVIKTHTCNISKTSGMGKVLRKCTYCSGRIHNGTQKIVRSLQDLRGNNRPFGNALILLLGDFRQTLPVISLAEMFSHQLLEVGNGKIPVDQTSRRISSPYNFYNLVTTKEELIEKVFPNI